jgi:acyl carrier protein
MTTADRIRLYIEEELLDGADLGDEDPIAVGLLDSLGVEQLVAFLEETFGVTFDDEQYTPENLSSIDAVAKVIDAKIGNRS